MGMVVITFMGPDRRCEVSYHYRKNGHPWLHEVNSINITLLIYLVIVAGADMGEWKDENASTPLGPLQCTKCSSVSVRS